MELNGAGPKEAEYIHKLLFKFDRSGALGRVWNKVKRKKNEYSRTEIAKFLSHRNDDYAYQFIGKLEEEGVLEEVGKRGTASNRIPVFKFHRKKLLDAFSDTEYYQENKELFAKTLDHTREGLDLT